TLIVHAVADINADITGIPGEDPIESMFFVSLAATTGSELTIRRVPIDFLDLELFTLGHMGLTYVKGENYISENGRTKLCDVTIKPSKLIAAKEKVHAR